MVQAVSFISMQEGWIATENQFIHTQDGGVTWHLVSDTPDSFFRLDFVSPSHGWGLGGGGLYATIDGGKTWKQQAIIIFDGEKRFQPSFDFINDQDGWLVGPDGSLHQTSDGGITWKNMPVPIDPHGWDDGFLQVTFISPLSGWLLRSFTMAQVSYSTLYKTRDGGQTWDSLSLSNFQTIEFIPTANAYFGIQSKPAYGVYYSYDNGRNWVNASYFNNIPSLSSLGYSPNGKNIFVSAYKDIYFTSYFYEVPLSVSTTALSLNSDSNSTSGFDIYSRINWNISINQSWLNIGSTSGSDSASVTIKASGNPNISSRTAMVIVSGNGVSPDTIFVTQAGSPASLSVSASTLNLPASAGSRDTFNIASNNAWNISTNKTWLSVNRSSGSDSSRIIITITDNPSVISRTARIIISENGVLPDTIVVTQAGSPASLSVSASTLNLPASSGSRDTFNISSNSAWNISIDKTWLSVNRSSGSDSSRIIATTTANPSVLSRTARIIISGNGVSPDTIVVTQAGSPAMLSISASSLNLGAEGNSRDTCKLISNISWTVGIDQAWLSVSPMSGSDTVTLSIKASANPTTSVRTATFVITGIGVSSQTVTVHQAASPNGIIDISDSMVNIYPVPVSDIMVVSLSKPYSQANIGIYTLNGALVYLSQINNRVKEVDMRNYAPGVYLVKISMLDGILVRKIIKQ